MEDLAKAGAMVSGLRDTMDKSTKYFFRFCTTTRILAMPTVLCSAPNSLVLSNSFVTYGVPVRYHGLP